MVYDEIYNYASQEKIFETTEIKIIISDDLLSNLENDYNEKMYKIDHIEIDKYGNEDFKAELDAFRKKINDGINRGLGFKDTENGWTLFYLFKELISHFQKDGFNYFRGQRSNWETIPSIFRSFKNEKQEKYYNNFENIYKTIQKKFPDKIKYISLSASDRNLKEKIYERSKQLALLQHYGIKTSLLDITSNPYIAMLFMISGKLENNFQLELYAISDSNLLFSDVEFSSFNKRITAQKGAFLNYDALIINDTKERIEEHKIKRIKISVHYDKEKINNNSDIEKIKNTIENEKINDAQEILSSIGELDTVEDEKNILLNIQKHFKRKLKEFGYEEFELFPDFEDYLKYTMGLYTIKENNDINTKKGSQ